MKPHARKLNEDIYASRRYKTIGDIMTADPTSRFMFRMGSLRGKHNRHNLRASKALRPPSVFQKLRAFKLTHNLA